MKSKIWNIFRIIIVISTLVLSTFFVMTINKLDVIPTKYFLILIAILAILDLIGVVLVLGKRLVTRIFGLFIAIIITLISIFGIGYSNNVSRLLDRAFNNNNIEITGYIVAVLKSSKYNKIEDLYL